MEIFLLEEGITDFSVETKLLQKTTEIVIKTSDFQKEFHKISPLLTDDSASTYQVWYILKWVGLRIPLVYPVAMNID